MPNLMLKLYAKYSLENSSGQGPSGRADGYWVQWEGCDGLGESII